MQGPVTTIRMPFLFRAAPRAFPARRGTARAFSEQRCTVRAQRSARGAWLRITSVPYAALRPCAARNRATRGTRRAAQGTRARGAARSCTLITQPAPSAGSPTEDIHRAGTPASLLLLCCHRHLQTAHRSPRSGLNRLVMPRPPAPGRQRGSPSFSCASGCSASRHPRRPPAPCALNCVTAAHRCSSPPPLAAAPHRRRRPGLPPQLAAPACLIANLLPCPPSLSEPCRLPLLPPALPPLQAPPPPLPPLLPLLLLSLSSTQPAEYSGPKKSVCLQLYY
jgi:hypothetical protein